MIGNIGLRKVGMKASLRPFSDGLRTSPRFKILAVEIPHKSRLAYKRTRLALYCGNQIREAVAGELLSRPDAGFHSSEPESI